MPSPDFKEEIRHSSEGYLNHICNMDEDEANEICADDHFAEGEKHFLKTIHLPEIEEKDKEIAELNKLNRTI